MNAPFARGRIPEKKRMNGTLIVPRERLCLPHQHGDRLRDGFDAAQGDSFRSLEAAQISLRHYACRKSKPRALGKAAVSVHHRAHLARQAHLAA